MSHDHLTDEQLSARLDGVLDAAEEARIDAHLAGCSGCADRLEAMAALDGSLLDAIDHDPGDAYFADFADRVAARIAADPKGEAALAREAAGVAGSGGAEAPGAPSPVVKPRAANPFAWLFTPRGLAFAGSAAVLVAAVGLGLQWYGQRGAVVSAIADRSANDRVTASESREAAPQALSMQAADSGVSAQSMPMATSAPSAAVEAKEKSAAGAPAPGSSPDRPAVAKQAAPGTLPLSPRAERAPGASRGPAAVRDVAPSRELAKRDAPAATPPAAANRAATPQAASELEGVSTEVAAKPTDDAAAGARAEAVTPPAPARVKLGETLSQSLRESSPLGKSLTGAPAPSTASPGATKRMARSDAGELKLDSAELRERCGVVRDSRGTPLAAAQVRVSGVQPANTRSGADGRYCLDAAPRVGDTLIVLRVGFEPVRIAITGPAALAVSMEPIGTLGEKGGMLTGLTAQKAPAPDVYADQPALVRTAVNAARAQAALAARERRAESYEKLVVLWDDVAERTSGAASYDARFRSVSALREAQTLAPEPARLDRLRHALESFVAATPRTLPERATVLRWQQELRGR